MPKGKQVKSKKVNTKVPFATAFLGKELNYLIENLSMLVSSGMNIVDALASISSEVKSKRMKRIVSQISDRVQGGSPLWRSMNEVDIFKPNVISLVRIGEESGRLSQNLKIVAEQEEKNRVFKSKIQSAMMYPVLVLVIMGVVGIGIAWFILPQLSTVFSQLRLDLPAITKALIAVGEFLNNHGTIAVPVAVIVFVFVILMIFSFKKTKFIGQWILFHLPGVKKLVQEVELARMGYLFGTLIQAGVPVTNSMESLARSADFPNYKRFYEYLSLQIRDGSSFKRSFESYEDTDKLIPHPIQQMIITGERSGNLSDMFMKIGSTFESRIDSTTKNLSVILEPILLVFVWVGVVLVALAVILPIYSLVGGLNTDPGVQSSPTAPLEEIIDREDKEEEVQVEPEVVEEAPEEPVVEEVSQTGTIQVLRDDVEFLYVRTEPDTESSIYTIAYPGDIYDYVEISEDSSWYRIRFEDDGTTGWVFADFVKEYDGGE